jgi:O-antigen/teichoic acid export membrane protein
MRAFRAVSNPVSSPRSHTILRQSSIGLVAKLGAIAATFASMPLLLRLLGEQELGAWLVLLSIFQWITMFDLGISAGARNEVARAVALKDELRARQAITTGWLYVVIVSLTLFAVGAGFLLLTPLAKWLEHRVFNGVDITVTLWLMLGGACITFALNFIQSAYAAIEKPSAFSIFSFLVSFGFLMLLLLASVLAINDMVSIAFMYVVAMISGNVYLIIRFRLLFPHYMPERLSFNYALSGVIVQFGVRLFIIQLAALLIFTTSRLLASAWLGPESVVVYDAGSKVFAIVTIVHTVLMTTVWSSFTQALERREIEWVRRTLRHLKVLMLPLIAGCAILAFASPGLVRLWLGDGQVGQLSFYTILAITTVLSCWSNIFAYMLNAVGDTRLQLVSSIAAAAINLPATYYFTLTLDMGLVGIVLGTLVSVLPFSILGPYAVKKSLRSLEKAQ